MSECWREDVDSRAAHDGGRVCSGERGRKSINHKLTANPVCTRSPERIGQGYRERQRIEDWGSYQTRAKKLLKWDLE